tara:strand:+ start:52 stop:816 length:765 start_codon:yes stop_codon:yes gene_type:complete
MAITETRQYREPFVEAAGLGVTNEGLRLLKQTLPTATYTGSQFVAGQSQLEKDAAKAAADLGQLTGTGAGTAQQAGSIASYMSPYQEQVIDASLAALDREQAKGLGALRNRAVQAGAFGSGREAALMGEYQASADVARAVQEAQLRQQGFADAVARRQADLQAQQGLGTYQTQLGAAERQLTQADLAAQQEAAREAAFADYTRLGLIGPQLASVIGGFPAATQVQSTPPPSTTQQLLGLGIGAAGLGGAIKGLF